MASKDGGAHKIKATSGWFESGNGTDDFGFAGLASGYYRAGTFDFLTKAGYWWSDESYDDEYAFLLGVYHYDTELSLGMETKDFSVSVRCLKN